MDKKMDRRVRKTRKQLQDGFTSLLLEKSIKDITVKELCDRADLNRGTFYIHYKDIYDIAEQVENEMLEKLETLLTSHTYTGPDCNLYPLILDLFILIKENSQFFTALLGNNGDIVFFNKLKSLLRDKCFKVWTNLCGSNKVDKFEYLYNFRVCGCVGIIESWLKDGLKESPEEISEIVCSIMIDGIKVIQ